MESYKYEPLDESKQEIRYLTLLPGNQGDDLEVTLAHMSFQQFRVQDQNEFGWELRHELEEARALLPEGWMIENTLEGRLIYWRKGDGRTTTWTHPNASFTKKTVWDRDKNRERAQFEALSYTWGDPTPVQPITILRGTVKYRLLITQNLFEALHYLRYQDKQRQLWVDSVCINQQDFPERSSQVARMDKIYGLARQVTVWLGTAETNSHLAVQKFQYLGEQMDHLKNRFSVATPGCVDPHLFVKKDLSLHGDVWEAIEALLSRKWFQRVWVKQEISLAPPGSTLICGSSSMTWHAFRRALIFLSGQNRTTLPNINNLGDLAFGLGGLDPLVVLRSLTRSRCFDPHDRIYGILAMVARSWAARIPVNYRMSTQKLYWKTLLADLAVNARLDLLDLAAALPERGEVIHFDLPCERHLASGFSPPTNEKLDDYCLAVLGRPRTTVRAVSVLVTDPKDDAMRIARQWYNDHRQQHVGNNFQDWEKTFVRTICQNFTLDRYELGCPSFEAWSDFILKGEPEIAGPVERDVIAQLDKKSIVTFEDGSFGLGPPTAQTGK